MVVNRRADLITRRRRSFWATKSPAVCCTLVRFSCGSIIANVDCFTKRVSLSLCNITITTTTTTTTAITITITSSTTNIQSPVYAAANRSFLMPSQLDWSVGRRAPVICDARAAKRPALTV
ncbi:hypothetical protein T02_15573 [Trichinella nativa]|uniref:Uncharacterized protein n=1 Tax=Trichinella nativa TaxID=6335 RepID=A0A0V1LIB3_9BILA|nr:hypothetical protein T02_15573 [Trichinella nativa]KRZ89222.1 hypothetical protein T08_2397 [Trichinella sp. T8]